MYTPAVLSLMALLVLGLLVSTSNSEKDKKGMYEALLPCLEKFPAARGVDLRKNLHALPPAQAETHYRDLLENTKHLRAPAVPVHIAAGYRGPWVENIFIERFLQEPLSTFNGLVPLFVQFVDIHVQSIQMQNDSHYTNSLLYIAKLLRNDVIYLAVSQDDQGLGMLSRLCPNILVLSAGGYGHIPIPLIKGEIAFIPPPPPPIVSSSVSSLKSPSPLRRFPIDVSFTGQVRPRLSRHLMLKEVTMLCAQQNLRCRKFGQSPNWLLEMNLTAVSLAPRGFGRTSYKFVEIIQMGRIPAYMFDDIPWLPYEGTEIGLRKFGFLGQFRYTMAQMTRDIVNLIRDPRILQSRLDTVKKVRFHYTYEGVMKQIESFLKSPLQPSTMGGDMDWKGDNNYLRCASRMITTDH